MSQTNEPAWRRDRPPYDDGTVILAILKPSVLEEYYDDPVAMRWWSHKGKSTECIRVFYPEEIEKWIPFALPRHPAKLAELREENAKQARRIVRLESIVKAFGSFVHDLNQIIGHLEISLLNES